MSTYVISDIHGQYEAFLDILNKIHFDISKDTLYLLGDYCDWGRGGFKVIEHIAEMQAQPGSNVIALRGNHDLMLLNVINNVDITESKTMSLSEANPHDLMLMDINRGAITLSEFYKLPVKKRIAMRRWLNKLTIAIDNCEVNGKKYYLCHSYPKLSGVSDYDVVWRRIRDKYDLEEFRSIYPEHILISGHTITNHYDSVDKQGRCKVFNRSSRMHYINIDCGAKLIGLEDTGRLACVRLDDMRYYYSQKC